MGIILRYVCWGYPLAPPGALPDPPHQPPPQRDPQKFFNTFGCQYSNRLVPCPKPPKPPTTPPTPTTTIFHIPHIPVQPAFLHSPLTAKPHRHMGIPLLRWSTAIVSLPCPPYASLHISPQQGQCPPRAPTRAVTPPPNKNKIKRGAGQIQKNADGHTNATPVREANGVFPRWCDDLLFGARKCG